MFADDHKIRDITNSTYQTPYECAGILHKLHNLYDALVIKFPDEFKHTIIERQPLPWGGFAQKDDEDEDDEGDDSDDEPVGGLPRPPRRVIAPKKPKKPQGGLPAAPEDQAILLMQDEKVGWELVAHLGWKFACDGEITDADLRKTLSGAAGWMPGAYLASAILRATLYWFSTFADRTKAASKAIAGWDKNSVYQLIAHGRDFTASVLAAPDLQEFAAHQMQAVDLPAMLAAAEATARRG